MNTSLVRRSSALAIAALALALGSAVASADDISNNLDATIDTGAEVMPLTLGGDPGSTTLAVTTANGDGKNGCNLTGSTTLTVSVASSSTAVATVSPSSVTFTSCSDTKVLTVAAVGVGSSTVSLAQTSNTTTGSFNLAPATFRVDVAEPTPTNTPPTVSVTGVTNGSSYEFGSVPAAGCSVVDAEDGNSTPAPSLSAITGPLAAYGLGEQTATCTYTDAGDLTAVTSASWTVVDTSEPVIAFESALPAANAAGWNKADVTLTWTCTDNVAVDSSASALTAMLSAEGSNQGATGTCVDVSGNTDSDTRSGINIDKTAPTVLWAGGPADGSSHYFGAVPAAATCTAVDGLSGPDGCAVSGHATSVGTHTVTATAHDVAGNAGSDNRSFTVLAWTLGGFFQPVDMGADVWNVVRGGSTVPLKFEVFAGATELTDTTVVDTFTVTGVTCPLTGATTDDIELTTSGGTTLRYDATAGQFLQNWQTPKKPGVCYRVTMTTDDGSSIGANFKLK